MNMQVVFDNKADEAIEKGITEAHNDMISSELIRMLEARGYEAEEVSECGRLYVAVK